MRERIPTYKGNENYIFVSYSHKDTAKVMPIMEKLCEFGCRIWYDEGIVPGSEWPEDIAQHLNNCAMAIAFISPNSMASVNCRREINFALSKQKPFLAVVLEPTEMPLGMELQLSTQQSVLRYNYRSEDQFLEKIFACPDLVRCIEFTKKGTETNRGAQQPAAPGAAPETAKPKPPKASAKRWMIVAGILMAAALVLCLCLVNGAWNDATADTITVYAEFGTWTDPYCWAWNSSKDVFASWPGEPMKPTGNGYVITLPDYVTGLKFSDPTVGMETSDIIVEAGRDIWIVERAGYYAWFYEKPTEAMLAEAFG